MAFEGALEDMMVDEVIVEPPDGVNEYGEPQYGSCATRTCRIVHRPQAIRDTDGREVLAKMQIFMGGDFATDPRARITLPDGSQPPILRVTRYPDEDGMHHEVILA